MTIDDYISGEAIAQSDQASSIDRTHADFGGDAGSTAPATDATVAATTAPTAS
jgi:hypothetical protein